MELITSFEVVDGVGLMPNEIMDEIKKVKDSVMGQFPEFTVKDYSVVGITPKNNKTTYTVELYGVKNK